MDTDFLLWLGDVRLLCSARGKPLQDNLSEKDLYEWKVSFDNQLSPSEAVYHLVDLEHSKLGIGDYPCQD